MTEGSCQPAGKPSAKRVAVSEFLSGEGLPRHDIDSSNGADAGISKNPCFFNDLCGGTCGAPLLLVCSNSTDAYHCDAYRCDAFPSVSEDPPAYAPSTDAAAQPSHWRQLFQTYRAPQVPPLPTPSGNMAMMTRLSSKCRCCPREAPKNAFSPTDQQQKLDGQEMPRLSQAAYLQTVHGKLEKDDSLQVSTPDSEVHVQLEFRGRVELDIQSGCKTEGKETVPVPSSSETQQPRTGRSRDSGSWSSIDLSDSSTGRLSSPSRCDPPEPRPPPYTPPLIRRRFLSVEGVPSPMGRITAGSLRGNFSAEPEKQPAPRACPSSPASCVPRTPPGSPSCRLRSASLETCEITSNAALDLPVNHSPIARVIDISTLEILHVDEVLARRGTLQTDWKLPETVTLPPSCQLSGRRSSLLGPDSKTPESTVPFRGGLGGSSELCADSVKEGYLAWSAALLRTITCEYGSAFWLVPQRPLEFFIGYKGTDCIDTSCPHAASLSEVPPSSGAFGKAANLSMASDEADHKAGADCKRNDTSEDMIDIIFDVLEEVSNCPFPLELLVLSMAFERLSHAGVGKVHHSSKVVNSRHHEVEAILLRYTALSSRLALREELELWFPTEGNLNLQRRGAANVNHMQGPDALGTCLSFEGFAAFISAHAAPIEHMRQAFAALPEGTSSSDLNPVLSGSRQVQHGLEVALAPLLAGLLTAIAGNGRNATIAAHRIARRAAELAIRGHETSARGSARPSTRDLGGETLQPADFAELFRSAASMARLCVMYLTEDAVRWRNRLALPSPRVNLQCSMGGG